jgi:hypothetical protein
VSLCNQIKRNGLVCPYIHPTSGKWNSRNFAFTEFSEVPQSPNFVRRSIYISLIQEYGAIVTWPRDRRVRVWDRYLPPS